MENSVIYLEKLSKLILRFLQELSKEMKELGITSSQLQGLTYISQHKECLIGDIANGLSISYPAATKLADRLVRKGLALRKEGEIDRRSVKVSLTPRGEETLKEAIQRRREKLSEITQHIESEEMTELVKMLEEFLRAALQDEDMIGDICLHCGSDHSRDCLVNKAYLGATGAEIEKF